MVAGGRGLAGVREGLFVEAVDVQGPGQGVRGVHGVTAGPLGAGGLQGRLDVAVVGGGERGVQVGVDAVGAGQRDPGVDEGVLVVGLRLVALGAPALVQLAEFHEGLGQGVAGDDQFHALDGFGAVAQGGLGAGAALQGGEIVLVGGEGAAVVVEGGLVVALVPGELAERAGHVGDVSGGGGTGERALQDAAGRGDVAAQFVHVRVPGEDRDAGLAGVGEVGGLRRLVVAAEFDERVDAGAQGALAVGVLLEDLVRVGQGLLELVPGGGERGLSLDGVLVPGRDLQRPLQGCLRLRVPGRVTLRPRLLHIRQPERRPPVEVLGLRPEMSLQRGDTRVQTPTGQQLRRHRTGRGDPRGPAVLRRPDGDGPGGHRHGQQCGTTGELNRPPATTRGGHPAYGGDAVVVGVGVGVGAVGGGGRVVVGGRVAVGGD